MKVVGRGHIPFFLTDTGVHGDGGEVTFAEKLVKLSCTERTLDEDNDLVELEGVEEVVELAVLLGFVELDAVLLKTVEGEFGIVVDIAFERISHEFLADRPDG